MAMAKQSDISNATQVSPHLSLEPFRPSKLDSRVARLWFTSLGLNMSSATLTMLAKQWISQYLSEMTSRNNGSTQRLQNQARLRQYRYEGLKRWHVAEIIASLPLILHLALLLFALGLILHLWSIDRITAGIITFLASVVTAFYFITAVISSYRVSFLVSPFILTLIIAPLRPTVHTKRQCPTYFLTFATYLSTCTKSSHLRMDLNVIPTYR